MSGKSRRKKDCPEFVTKDLCAERSGNIVDKITSMEKNLTEKLNGIDKKVDGIANDKKTDTREKSSAKRNALITILSGVLVALAAWGLSHVHF